MSYEAVQAVLERTVTDPSFRTRLFTQPEEALAEYELNPDENSALRELCVDAGQSESAALDRRETKKVLPFWLTGGLKTETLRVLLNGVSAQRPTHSVFLGGEQLPLEARMGGVFLGFLCATLLIVV